MRGEVQTNPLNHDFAGGLGSREGVSYWTGSETNTEENSPLRYAKALDNVRPSTDIGRGLTSLQFSRHNTARWHGSSSGRSLIKEITSLVMSALGAASCVSLNSTVFE